jgi:hypothetical protein
MNVDIISVKICIIGRAYTLVEKGTSRAIEGTAIVAGGESDGQVANMRHVEV